MKCKHCDGTGEIINDALRWTSCPACGGKGETAQTNEEWLHYLNTEQLAEELLAWWFDGANTYSQFGLFKWEIDEAKEKIMEWLKQPHKGVI